MQGLRAVGERRHGAGERLSSRDVQRKSGKKDADPRKAKGSGATRWETVEREATCGSFLAKSAKWQIQWAPRNAEARGERLTSVARASVGN